jgi:hypothetical protein
LKKTRCAGVVVVVLVQCLSAEQQNLLFSKWLIVDFSCFMFHAFVLLRPCAAVHESHDFHVCRG